MGKEYTIGDVAELLNVSRDALRFYEKKGLVLPKKKQNGYRYYSEEDVRLLLDLLFWRKLQCSLQDIQSMYENGSPEFYVQFLELRIQEERERIQEHQKLLKHLLVSRNISRKVELDLNRYSVRPIPKMYIVSEILETFDEGRDAWFRAADEQEGLEHCYIHEQLLPKQDGTREQRCYLALEEFAVKEMKLERLVQNREFFQFPACVYTVYASDSMSPDQKAVSAMERWAKRQGLSLTGEVHAHYLWNRYSGGELACSYMELFMPIQE